MSPAFLSEALLLSLILCHLLLCKSRLHSNSTSLASQSVIISHRSVLPVNQPDSQPGCSITHLLCPRRGLPPDPHDAAVIPATSLRSLSLSLSFFVVHHPLHHLHIQCCLWMGPIVQHACCCCSRSVLCHTKFPFTSLSGHHATLSRFLSPKKQLSSSVQSWWRDVDLQLFKKKNDINHHTCFQKYLVLAKVCVRTTENASHKSQLFVVCSPLVKLSYSSCRKKKQNRKKQRRTRENE